MIRRIISIIVSLSLVFPSFIRNVFLPLLQDKLSVKYTKITVKELLTGVLLSGGGSTAIDIAKEKRQRT